MKINLIVLIIPGKTDHLQGVPDYLPVSGLFLGWFGSYEVRDRGVGLGVDTIKESEFHGPEPQQPLLERKGTLRF